MGRSGQNVRSSFTQVETLVHAASPQVPSRRSRTLPTNRGASCAPLNLCERSGNRWKSNRRVNSCVAALRTTFGKNCATLARRLSPRNRPSTTAFKTYTSKPDPRQQPAVAGYPLRRARPARALQFLRYNPLLEKGRLGSQRYCSFRIALSSSPHEKLFTPDDIPAGR